MGRHAKFKFIIPSVTLLRLRGLRGPRRWRKFAVGWRGFVKLREFAGVANFK